MTKAPPLPSDFLAGFECANQKLPSGERLDLAAATRHLQYAESDYALIAGHGMRAARDGLRWAEIEREPGIYDWASFLGLLRAAERHGVDVIWDLCHYGVPDWIDLSSPGFIQRFAMFARAAAQVLRDESPMPPRWCPLNEISFWAWAGGDGGGFNPFWRSRGYELKRQLARAAVAAIREVRAVDADAAIYTAEPLIRVVAQTPLEKDVAAAAAFHNAQFEALDMLLGITAPELGGFADSVDVIGLNYYPENQWVLGGGKIVFGHHDYRPLSALLQDCATRYGRPLLIAETGAEGSAKAAWLHYVMQEVRTARAGGADIVGVCLYPVLDYPGWENSRLCPAGLFGNADSNGKRYAYPDFLAELQRQQAIGP